jgi:hypothetical protein
MARCSVPFDASSGTLVFLRVVRRQKEVQVFLFPPPAPLRAVMGNARTYLVSVRSKEMVVCNAKRPLRL